MLSNSQSKPSNVLYALEYTPRVLRLLSLEKKAAVYHVTHYEQRLLNSKSGRGNAGHGTLIQNLQDMRRALPGERPHLVIGIQDTELIIQSVYCKEAGTSQLYRQGLAILNAQQPLLGHYSWDMAPLCAYQGVGQYALWVAYPLQKISLLQTLCDYCDFTLLAIEPSVCAIARASHVLLEHACALFLLQDAQLLTLLLVVQGEVYALRQFTDPELWAQHAQAFMNDPTLGMYMKNITTVYVAQELAQLNTLAQYSRWKFEFLDVLQYVNAGAHYSVEADRLHLFTCAGLALRAYA